MWGKSDTREEHLSWAIKFTGDHAIYGAAMLRVVNEWLFSCEHNLSNPTQNRKAWIGHAACALANNCPEDIVREAWGYLAKPQQEKANAVADLAIHMWEQKQCLN
jgi:hypothetical protein